MAETITAAMEVARLNTMVAPIERIPIGAKAVAAVTSITKDPTRSASGASRSKASAASTRYPVARTTANVEREGDYAERELERA